MSVKLCEALSLAFFTIKWEPTKSVFVQFFLPQHVNYRLLHVCNFHGYCKTDKNLGIINFREKWFWNLKFSRVLVTSTAKAYGQSCIPPSTFSPHPYPSLWHSHSLPLLVPRTHLVSVFVSVVSLWNSLPSTIHSATFILLHLCNNSLRLYFLIFEFYSPLCFFLFIFLLFCFWFLFLFWEAFK